MNDIDTALSKGLAVPCLGGPLHNAFVKCRGHAVGKRIAGALHRYDLGKVPCEVRTRFRGVETTQVSMRAGYRYAGVVPSQELVNLPPAEEVTP